MGARANIGRPRFAASAATGWRRRTVWSCSLLGRGPVRDEGSPGPLERRAQPLAALTNLTRRRRQKNRLPIPRGGQTFGPAGTFAISLREGSDTSMSRTTRRHQMVTCRRFKPTPASSPSPEAASHSAHNEAHHEDPQPRRSGHKGPGRNTPCRESVEWRKPPDSGRQVLREKS